METTTRKSRAAKRDDAGRLRRKIGGRGDTKVFYFPKTVSDAQIEDRTANIKKVYQICLGWSELSLFIAEQIRAGTTPTPLPPMEREFRMFARRAMPDDWRDYLVRTFPFVSWETLAESDLHPAIKTSMEAKANRTLDKSAARLAQLNAGRSVKARAIPGRLHDALRDYQAEVVSDEPNGFDRQGKIKQLLVRHPNQPLATLDLDACKVMLNYWRSRPQRHDGSGQYSVKRSREQLRELLVFFKWLHISTKYLWRKPDDFEELDKDIKKPKGEKKSVADGKRPVFSVEELATLVRHAGMPEKLWIVWCLNNSHGAGEVGRVQWEDIYLDQDHPWRSKGLDIWEGGDWIGLRRPKTDVLGWWLLWPETVELLKQWEGHCEGIFGRPVKSKDWVIIRESGAPLYGDNKNAQASFANQLSRLKKQCKATGNPVADLPPGTLRDQFADWCGGHEADAIVASIALAHGIPHQDDKLLYKHYANKPWRRLFEKQLEYRDYCRPVLDAIHDATPLPVKQTEFLELWPTLTGKKLERVLEACSKLQISKATVYRYLEQFPEMKS